MVKVLFVCMGNICRSPTAEGVFRDLVAREGLSHIIETDSAGTHSYHVGNPPDKRAQAAAAARGVQLDDLRARKAVPGDFDAFDYILAMDGDNHSDLAYICPPGLDQKLHMFLSFAPSGRETDVPDPYYGGPAGFDYVLDLVEEASHGLLDHIRKTTL